MENVETKQRLEKLEGLVSLTSKTINVVMVVALALFSLFALLSMGGAVKAVAYIGAIGWFLLEWCRGHLLDKANLLQKRELERVQRRLEIYETKERVQKTKFRSVTRVS